MAYDSRLMEEEIKNKVRRDYFADYDVTEVIDDMDFAVAIPRVIRAVHHYILASIFPFATIIG